MAERRVRQIVTITKHWHQPSIQIQVTEEIIDGVKGHHIGLAIPLDDYLSALTQEIPWYIRWCRPTGTLLLTALKKASTTVLSKVKQESVKIL